MGGTRAATAGTNEPVGAPLGLLARAWHAPNVHPSAKPWLAALGGVGGWLLLLWATLPFPRWHDGVLGTRTAAFVVAVAAPLLLVGAGKMRRWPRGATASAAVLACAFVVVQGAQPYPWGYEADRLADVVEMPRDWRETAGHSDFFPRPCGGMFGGCASAYRSFVYEGVPGNDAWMNETLTAVVGPLLDSGWQARMDWHEAIAKRQCSRTCGAWLVRPGWEMRIDITVEFAGYDAVSAAASILVAGDVDG